MLISPTAAYAPSSSSAAPLDLCGRDIDGLPPDISPELLDELPGHTSPAQVGSKNVSCSEPENGSCMSFIELVP